jgi:excisionase family DNA binding protein
MRKQQLYSPDEVAEILGVAPSTLARWRRTGDPDLPYVRLGGRVRYRASDIDRFLDEMGHDDSESDDDEDADDEDEDDGS